MKFYDQLCIEAGGRIKGPTQRSTSPQFLKLIFLSAIRSRDPLPGRHITTQSGTKTAFHDQEITWSNFKATKINNNTLDDNIASISRLRSFLNPQTQAATAHGQRKNRGINVNIHL